MVIGSIVLPDWEILSNEILLLPISGASRQRHVYTSAPPTFLTTTLYYMHLLTGTEFAPG